MMAVNDSSEDSVCDVKDKNSFNLVKDATHNYVDIMQNQRENLIKTICLNSKQSDPDLTSSELSPEEIEQLVSRCDNYFYEISDADIDGEYKDDNAFKYYGIDDDHDEDQSSLDSDKCDNLNVLDSRNNDKFNNPTIQQLSSIKKKIEFERKNDLYVDENINGVPHSENITSGSTCVDYNSPDKSTLDRGEPTVNENYLYASSLKIRKRENTEESTSHSMDIIGNQDLSTLNSIRREFKKLKLFSVGYMCSNILESTLNKLQGQLMILVESRNKYINKNRDSVEKTDPSIEKESLSGEVNEDLENYSRRIRIMQCRELNLLLLKFRKENRNLCTVMDDINAKIEREKQILRNSVKEVEHLSYQKLWFTDKIKIENEFQTHMWDKLQKEMICKEEYKETHKLDAEFIDESTDSHKFTLNWLHCEMQERIKGAEELCGIIKYREKAEQKLECLKNQEKDIIKKMDSLHKVVKDVYIACKIDKSQQNISTPDAGDIPLPLIALHKKFSDYKLVISDEYFEVVYNSDRVEYVNCPPNDNHFHPTKLIIKLLHDGSLPFPTHEIPNKYNPFPFSITFIYFPKLDAVLVDFSLKNLLFPEKKLTLLSNILGNCENDFGFIPSSLTDPSSIAKDNKGGNTNEGKGYSFIHYHWVQELAELKSSPSQTSIQSYPLVSDVVLQNLFKKIRCRLTLRTWLAYHLRHLRSRIDPNWRIMMYQNLSEKHGCSIESIVELTDNEYNKLGLSILNPASVDTLCLNLLLRCQNMLFDAYIMIPLNEKCPRFQLFQIKRVEEAGIKSEGDPALLDTDDYLIFELNPKLIKNFKKFDILNFGINEEIDKDSENTNFTCNQYPRLKVLENYLNKDVVRNHEAVDSNYRFSILCVQVHFLMAGLELYVSGHDIEKVLNKKLSWAQSDEEKFQE